MPIFIRPKKRDDDDDDDDWRPKHRHRGAGAGPSESLTPLQVAARVAERCSASVSTLVPPDALVAKLKPYQVAGVSWALGRISGNGVGVILADEMGLGKTAQAIAVIGTLPRGRGEATLVVAPLSVVRVWENEMAFFAPHLRLLRFVGTRDERDAIVAHVERAATSDAESSVQAGAVGCLVPDYDVVLTTPEILLSDAFFLTKLAITALVFDEAHRLKNARGKLYGCILDGLAHVRHRLLLTGTPLHNHPQELWALLRLANPALFGACAFLDSSPAASSAALCSHEANTALQQVCAALMLRRLKLAVLADLPPLTELLLPVPLSPLQRRLYLGILTKNAAGLIRGPKRALLNTVMQLRKCCNHPYMFDGVEPEPFVAGEHIVTASGKLVVLDALLRRLRAEGHRVLIFSQFTLMLDLLQDFLELRGWAAQRLDGSVRGEERWAAVESFQTDTDVFAFLLSTRSGGVGLTLTAADTVIFIDSDWNPQMDLQAAQRAHRIGQARAVTVYRLVAEGTVEDAVVRRAQHKRVLATRILGEGRGGAAGSGSSGESTAAAEASGAPTPAPTPPPEAELRDLVFWTAAAVGMDAESDAAWATLIESAASPMPECLVARRVSVDSGAATAPGARGAAGGVYQFAGTDFSDVVRRGAAALEAKHNALLLAGAAALGPRRAAATAATANEEVQIAHAAALSPPSKRRALTEEETEELRMKRRARWEKAGYRSALLPLDAEAVHALAAGGAEGEGEAEGDSDACVDGAGAGGLRHISGDLAAPVAPHGTDMPRIVLVPINDSGNWCSAGVFAAVEAAVPTAAAQYEAAKRHGDLRLGDAHALAAAGGTFLYVLAVVQKSGGGAELVMEALDTVLRRIATFVVTDVPRAQRRLTTVHCPNIAASPAAAYSLDKLLCHRLPGIACFIYHFRRARRPPRCPVAAAGGPTQLATAGAVEVAVHATRPICHSQLSEGTFCLLGFGPADAAAHRMLMRTILLHGGVLVSLDEVAAGAEGHVIIVPRRDFEPPAAALALHEQGVPVVEPSWVELRVAAP